MARLIRMDRTGHTTLAEWSAADRLYTEAGWRRVGEIPRYALMPDGAPCATTVFYKAIDRGQHRGAGPS